MCLKSVDEKIKPHEFGYKIIKRVDSGEFVSEIMRTPFRFRKWYSARDKPGGITQERAFSGQAYDAGFHYFLSENDAITKAGHFVVCKIKPKNILHTGIDQGVKVGVSEDIMLLNICYDADNNRKKFKAKMRKIANKLTKFDIEDFILERGRKYKSGPVPENELQKILASITKDDESFKRWIVFIDSFARDSAVFKYATRLHIILHKRRNTTYCERYIKVCGRPDLVYTKDRVAEMQGHKKLY